MTLLAQLNTLETTGLIRLAAMQPELEYLFRHALVQDAAYGSLLRNDRKRLHQSTGEALEQLYAARVEEIASTLALHFEKAEQHDKAIHYFTLAGDRARAGFANNEAIQFYQSALSQIEITGTDGELRCTLYEALGDLLNLIGQREAAREYLTKAIARLPAPIVQARLHRKIALSLVDERSFPGAEEHFARSEELLQQVRSTESEWWQEFVQNQLDRFWMYYIQNRADEVKKILQELQPWVEANGNAAQKARFFMGLTHVNLRQYRYVVTPEHLAISRKGLDAALASNDPNLIAELRFAQGFLSLWQGSWAEAETELEAAITICKQTGNITILARSFTYLVVLHRVRKDRPRLLMLLPEFAQILRTAGLKEYTPYIQAVEAWFAWQDNNLPEAERKAQEALTALRKHVVMIPFHWLALWLLLSISFQQENLSAAIEHAKAMLDPAQQRLSEEITAALEAAVQAGEREQLEAARAPLAVALRLATEKGYL